VHSKAPRLRGTECYSTDDRSFASILSAERKSGEDFDIFVPGCAALRTMEHCVLHVLHRVYMLLVLVVHLPLYIKLYWEIWHSRYIG
jgi:hypothetical protein